ncbi:MAG TPA: hypothetical protein VGJ26_03400 [Pirellulales bacterium]|jgi:hypothetical protein
MFIYSRFSGLLVVSGLVLLSSVAPAMATPVVFFDHDERALASQPFPNTTAARNSFLSQVATLGGTGYDQNLSSGIPNPTANPSFGFPGSTITASTTNFTYQGVSSVAVNNANNGAASLGLIETEVAGGTATTALHNWIDFSQPINAFGVYLCQAGDVLGHPVTIVLENTATGSTEDVVVNVGPNWQGFSIAYLGIIDTGFLFNQVTMTEDTDVDNNGVSDDLQDGIILDNLTVAALPVPEPSSLLLLSMGALLPLLGRCWSGARTSK